MNKQVNHDQTGLISKFLLKSVRQNLSSSIECNGKKLYQTDSDKCLVNINKRNTIQDKTLRSHKNFKINLSCNFLLTFTLRINNLNTNLIIS